MHFAFHGGSILLWGAAVLALKQEAGVEGRRDFNEQVRRRLARPWRYVFTAILCYALADFALIMATREGTDATVIDQHYWLMNKGRAVHELTREAYDAYIAREARSVSGFWMLACLFPALVFTTRRPAGRERPMDRRA
ncbi:MAG: hypothetical protein QM767_20685 [Anaeromyxobacter sp.]